MKRYWKIISILTIVVLTIGTFYIQSMFAKANYPDFFIEAISGDEELLNNIVVSGYYRAPGKESGNEISKDHTLYWNQASYIDILMGEFQSSKFKKLQKEYRSFMRGKENEFSIVENEELLIYSDVNERRDSEFLVKDATLEIDILQKDSKHKSSFSVPISLDGRVDYLYINRVEQYEDTLHVAVEMRLDKGDGFQTEYYLYRLDVGTGKLLSTEAIDFQKDLKDANDFTTYSIYDVSKDEQSEYIVFIADASELIDSDEGYDSELVDRGVFAYELANNEITEVELPDEIGIDYQVDSLVDNTIYLTKEQDEALNVIGYNVETNEIETNYTVDIDEGFTTFINDNYLITLSEFKSNTVEGLIKVADLQTRDVIFEGSIEMDQKEKITDYELEIHSLIIN